MSAPPPEHPPRTRIGDIDATEAAAVVEEAIRLEKERERNRHIRLENAAKWQQRLGLIFIGLFLPLLFALGGWSFYTVLTDDIGHHVDVAWHFLSVLVDAGVAATVAFLAVRVFER